MTNSGEGDRNRYMEFKHKFNGGLKFESGWKKYSILENAYRSFGILVTIFQIETEREILWQCWGWIWTCDWKRNLMMASRDNSGDGRTSKIVLTFGANSSDGGS